jgi:hypothetical protein
MRRKQVPSWIADSIQNGSCFGCCDWLAEGLDMTVWAFGVAMALAATPVAAGAATAPAAVAVLVAGPPDLEDAAFELRAAVARPRELVATAGVVPACVPAARVACPGAVATVGVVPPGEPESVPVWVPPLEVICGTGVNQVVSSLYSGVPRVLSPSRVVD